MATLNPYLNFNGNAEEAFRFYRSVFSGEFSILMRYKEMPEQQDLEKIPDSEKEKIMHVALPIGDTLLMGSDVLEPCGQQVSFGNQQYISIQPKTREEAEQIFKGLSEGGKVEMPLEEMFWGDLFSSFRDKYGIYWMINYDLQKDKKQ